MSSAGGWSNFEYACQALHWAVATGSSGVRANPGRVQETITKVLANSLVELRNLDRKCQGALGCRAIKSGLVLFTGGSIFSLYIVLVHKAANAASSPVTSNQSPHWQFSTA